MWNKTVCGQWVLMDGSRCLKHRVLSTDGVVGPPPGKADGVGAGSLWLLEEALWVCWHRNRPAGLRFGNPVTERLQRNTGPSLPVPLSGTQHSCVSSPQGGL